ncbi:maltose/moltooligosaccharide transporter [Chishuiella changwenlii]|uniref:Maltose/moltooligosaccharide transporter n=1 Tax=Chishuiella changwenlii TaxID=1434701 RepID=A0A1M6TAK7_9FLAO|nr:MFS transporter [Chishuiella changwenlii]GGE95390.1 sugar transporter [Chishuiella changwenlii]SHK53778.1 maltose/moltooligosaccharide transporter [Chishuiella changwenlii]
MEKRRLSFWEIWNLSFGYLGVQMGFALQNANASRILSSFGADVHELSWFWIVAPLMGLIVQPIIGHYSDNTWSRFGRRKPYFLVGALLASIGLILMPQAGAFTALMPALWMGAGFLMIMDASFNIAMEPMRAFVADMLPSDQRTLGYSVQTVIIGLGAVVGSWLPYILNNWLNVSSTAGDGEIPFHIILSFIIGAIAIIITVGITILSTKEYSPQELEAFDKAEDKTPVQEDKTNLSQILVDFGNMPKTMKQLGLVQFFTWFALFGMWVFATPAIAHHVYGLSLTDTHSATYQKAGDWVGIIFGVYNGVSAIFAFFLPAIALKLGRKTTHTISLLAGGLGLISIYFISDPKLLIVSMIGVGIAWASILSMPYAILAGAIPSKKMGVYMGIFNFFICMPQIVNALLGGPIVKYFYNGNPIFAIVMSGVSLIVAALFVTRVTDVDEPTKA